MAVITVTSFFSVSPNCRTYLIDVDCLSPMLDVGSITGCVTVYLSVQQRFFCGMVWVSTLSVPVLI